MPADSTAPTKLTAIAIEALDPAAQTRVWADALNWRPSETAVHSARPDGLSLHFVPTTRPKTTKNRLHLDLAGGGGADDDQRRQVARLLDLGAVPADIGQGDVPWDVLADPEGNEFCVLPEPAADGHLVAICQDAADVRLQGPFWTAAAGWSIADQGDWGISLRALAANGTPVGPRLVMGPPAAPKTATNRWRFVLADSAPTSAAAALDLTAARQLQDPEGNEYHHVTR